MCQADTFEEEQLALPSLDDGWLAGIGRDLLNVETELGKDNNLDTALTQRLAPVALQAMQGAGAPTAELSDRAKVFQEVRGKDRCICCLSANRTNRHFDLPSPNFDQRSPNFDQRCPGFDQRSPKLDLGITFSSSNTSICISPEGS